MNRLFTMKKYPISYFVYIYSQRCRTVLLNSLVGFSDSTIVVGQSIFKSSIVHVPFYLSVQLTQKTILERVPILS